MNKLVQSWKEVDKTMMMIMMMKFGIVENTKIKKEFLIKDKKSERERKRERERERERVQGRQFKSLRERIQYREK